MWRDRIAPHAFRTAQRIGNPADKPSNKKTLHAQYKMLTTKQMQLRKEHMIVSMSNK